jgi:hypothetical protein
MSPMPSLVRLPFLGSFCNIGLVLFLTPVSLVQCHFCTVGQPSADSSKFLSGPTIALGPFLQLPEAPYG